MSNNDTFRAAESTATKLRQELCFLVVTFCTDADGPQQRHLTCLLDAAGTANGLKSLRYIMEIFGESKGRNE